jgi:para-nitrobenzyl esterase
MQNAAMMLPAWPPVIDGVVLTANPASLLAQGKLPRIPVMNGVTRSEADLFSALALQRADGASPTDLDYQSALNSLFGSYLGAWLYGQYPTSSYGSAVKAFGAMMTDWFYSCPTRLAWDSFAATTPTYAYQFDDPQALGLLSVVPRGASHGSDLAFLFNPSNPLLTTSQQGLAQQMTRYWANFAATGDPNTGPFGGQDLAWPRYGSGPAAQLRDLLPSGSASTTLDMTTFRTQHRCSLWGL